MKKILALVACLSLVASLAIGGSIAYLTDRDSEANVFTMGDVKIDLTEEGFTNGSQLLPGQTLVKNPVVENIGETDAYVWLTIAYPAGLDNELINGDIITFNGFQADQWDSTVATKKNVAIFEDKPDEKYNVYTHIYKEILTKEQKTPVLFESVKMNEYVDIDPDGNMHYVYGGTPVELGWNINEDANGNPTIYISAYAIQSEGFKSAKDAYDHYYMQWGNDGKGDKYAPPAEISSHEGVNYVTSGDKGSAVPVDGDTVYRGIFSDGVSTVTEVEIGEGITRLNNRALCKMPNLTKVTLPDSLTYIDESVFQQSGFVEIEIPENVTYIGKYAFGSCDSLEKIVINAKNVTFANFMARDCKNLKEVYIYSDSVTFESGSMYFTNEQTGDASGITFYVKDPAMADALNNALSASHYYGLLIKSLDGKTEFYNTLKSSL